MQGVVRSADDTAETTEETRALTKDVSDAGSEPLETSMEHSNPAAGISDSHINPEQLPSSDQNALSSRDCVPPQGTSGRANQTPEPPACTEESNVQQEQPVPDAKVLASGDEAHLAAVPEDPHLRDITVVVSPPDLVDSPTGTWNGDSQARYTSSCYSTPTAKSRFHHTPETSQLPESIYLRTPHDSNSYIKLLDDSFGLSTPAETPDRHNALCTPPTTIAETLGVFERSVGKGHQGSDPFLSLSNVLDEQNKEKGEASGPVEGVAQSTVVEQPAQETANKDSASSDDRANIESESPCAWERAMESQKQSFQIEIEDLKEDHAAKIGELKERIAKQEKEAEAAKKRKAYVEKIANKKIADIKKAKDADETYYLGLWDAAECTMADKIWEKNEQLEQKDAMIKRQNEWAVTTSSWNTELQHELDDAKLNFIRPLQQEVARLTAWNLENAQTISYQSSQITLLQDTQTRIQNDQPQLMIQLAQVCDERDQYKAGFEHYGGLYEQANTDLIAAQHEIQKKEQQLNDFNYAHEDKPHLTEAVGLLAKTREAYQSLELKANECLFREQQERKRHEQDKNFWLLENERKQKMIDNLGAKIGLLETWNTRLTNNLEQRIVSEHVDDRLPSLYERSQQTVEDLQSYMLQQESQIAAQNKEIHQHKTTISLQTQTLEEKNIEIQELQDSKIHAERQIKEIQTRSDEKEIVSATELQQATDEINWYQTQNQNLRSQIHKMVDDGVPAALIENHQAEIQNLQQHITDLNTELQHHRAQQQNQHTKDWHDANAAALSERSNQILRLNWENANAEVAKLKDEIAALQRCQGGGSAPQFDGVSQHRGEDTQRLQGKLDASTQETQNVVADVLVLGELAGAMWHSLRDTGVRDADEELLKMLGPVADGVEEVVRRYSDQEVGVEVEEDLELEDYVDDAEELGPETGGNTTIIPAQGDALRIPSSTFRDSWAFDGNNPFARDPGFDGREENHYTPTLSPPRPGYTFTPPSPSDSDSDSSTHTPNYSTLSEGNNTPEAQNRGYETPERLSDNNQKSNTDTQHDPFDAFTNPNNGIFEDEDTPTPTPTNQALVPYNPPEEADEEADEELITRAAYDTLYPIPMPQGFVEWGHETIDTRPDNGDTRTENALWNEFDGVQEREDEDGGDEDGGDEDGAVEDRGDEDGGDEAVLEQQEGHVGYTDEEVDALLAEFRDAE